MTRSNAGRAREYVLVRHRHNWLLLLKFSVVGGSGVFVNLAVFSLMLEALGQHHYHLAAVIGFLVANTTNYLLNKFWTFQVVGRQQLALEYTRFLTVGLVGLVLNLVILTVLVAVLDLTFTIGGVTATDKHVAQAIAIALITPVSFVGNKLWTFGAARKRQGTPPSA